MHINDLNDDCLKCVLICLSPRDRVKCETVCKLWQQLVRQTLCSQTKISTKSSCLETDKLKLDSDGLLFLKILSNCPNLRSIDLTNTELNEEIVTCLAKGCVKLDTFTCNDSKTFTDEILSIFLTGNYAKRLTDITLSNTKLTEYGLKCLLENCPKLKSLDISHNDCVTGETSFRSFGSRIASVNIGKCRYIRESGIRCLAEGNGSRITRLIIGSYVSYDVINYIAVNMRNLSHLSIDAHYYPQSFRETDLALIAKLVKLEFLSLKNLPVLLKTSFDRTLIKILRALPKLKHLSLIVAQISDKVFKSLSDYCPLLETLHYQYSTHPKAINRDLTNKAAVYLIGLKNLRQLSLNGTEICDTIADIIIANKTLVCVELYYCSDISDLTVTACIELAKTNVNLFIRLKIKSCNKFSDTDCSDLPNNIVIHYLN